MKNIKSSVTGTLAVIVFSVFGVAAQNSVIEPTVASGADNKPKIKYNAAINKVNVMTPDLVYGLPNTGSNPLVKSRTLAIFFSFTSEGKTPKADMFVALSIHDTAKLSVSEKTPAYSNFDATVERINAVQMGYTLKKSGGKPDENKKLNLVIGDDYPSSAMDDEIMLHHTHYSVILLEREKFVELSQAEEIYIVLDKRKYLLHIPKSSMPVLQEMAKLIVESKAK